MEIDLRGTAIKNFGSQIIKISKEAIMRMLLNVKLPNTEFNAAIRDGSVGNKMGEILEEIKPEAAYFTEQGGQRSALLIVDIDDPAKIPMLAEPWFLTFNANVELKVIMTPEDLKRAGLEELGRKWSM